MTVSGDALLGAPAVALLSIGTELTRGELVDTNAAWLSAELTATGFSVVEQCTVSDDVNSIASAIQRLAGRAGLVISTGGLGPTSDDLTSEAAAAAAGLELERNTTAIQRLRLRYEARGIELTEARLSQADYPKDSELLDNPVGTADGFVVRVSDTPCFFLPGVPTEMRAIFRSSIQPRLEGRVTSYQVGLRTFGLPEAEVAARVEAVKRARDSSVTLTYGYRASHPEVIVKVLAHADSEHTARLEAEAEARAIKEALGDFVYGDHDDSLEAVVAESLRHHGLTLSLAESCTGGLLAGMLTRVPGSSAFFLLSAVVYANGIKTRVVDVDPDILRAHGAVSEECARAMALGALRVAGSDLALSITGIAGPGGGSTERPVGTVWFALASAGDNKEVQVTTALHRFIGDREQVRRATCFVALDMIRRFSEGASLDEVHERSRVR